MRINNIKSYYPLPKCLTIKPSKIHGLGLFATENISKGTNLGITHFINADAENGLIRTPLGGFVNHSYTPNTDMIEEEKTWVLVIKKEIKKGEELVVDYTPWYDAEILINYN